MGEVRGVKDTTVFDCMDKNTRLVSKPFGYFFIGRGRILNSLFRFFFYFLGVVNNFTANKGRYFEQNKSIIFASW
jgi:hypothetical protein